MFSVEGFEIIICGGSRGIGQALAKGFINAKAKVTIFDINNRMALDPMSIAAYFFISKIVCIIVS